MFDGGLSINLKEDQENFVINHCCLRNNPIVLKNYNKVWNNVEFITSRKNNERNHWDPACDACRILESAGLQSYRTGAINQFGIRKNLTGPMRIDLNFDISCNLACRTCAPSSSTYWQKHLKENKLKFYQPTLKSRIDDLLTILKNLDLSNLEMVVLAGGESLMGTAYWRAAEYIINSVPNAKDKLILSFQTNATQTIDKKYYELIEKCHLVKLNFSIDGVGEQFNYLRWPAEWEQVTNNMFELRKQLPVNVMFHVEETVSIFNLFYLNDLETWLQNNFAFNRLGPNKQGEYGNNISHGRHLAGGIFGLINITQSYVDAVRKTKYANLIQDSWQENPEQIQQMIKEIRQFDTIRNQDFTKTFPEVADFYSEYLR
jgi:organic radical activating enzyme